MPPDLSRYHRQMLLPGIGQVGQERLVASHALLVGCGALGTAIADLLVRAGVGSLTIIDRDVVELTNLQRQTLFDEADAISGSPKAHAAAARLARINSGVAVRPIAADFGPRNAERLFTEHTPRPAVLLDGTDNFQTRYLLNDLAVKHGVPLVYGGAVGTGGMSMTIRPGGEGREVGGGGNGGGPCLRCLFEQPPPPGATPTCDTAGVLGPVTAMVGAWQAAEAIKILAGAADSANSTLVEFDLWSARVRQLDVSRSRRVPGDADPGCPACVQRRFEFLDGQVAVGTTVLCGRNSVQVTPPLELMSGRLDLSRLAERLASHGVFTATPLLLRGRLRPTSAAQGGDAEDDGAGGVGGGGGGLELTVFPDGRAIIGGTTEPAVARSIYARFVGS